MGGTRRRAGGRPPLPAFLVACAAQVRGGTVAHQTVPAVSFLLPFLFFSFFYLLRWHYVGVSVTPTAATLYVHVSITLPRERVAGRRRRRPATLPRMTSETTLYGYCYRLHIRMRNSTATDHA